MCVCGVCVCVCVCVCVWCVCVCVCGCVCVCLPTDCWSISPGAAQLFRVALEEQYGFPEHCKLCPDLTLPSRHVRIGRDKEGKVGSHIC